MAAVSEREGQRKRARAGELPLRPRFFAGQAGVELRRQGRKGLLCVKGYHVGLAPYGKDRLTRPLLRCNGRLEPISWEQAIEVVAERVLKDPKGFAVHGSGQWTIPEGHAAPKFIKAGLGTNLIDPNARLCMASAVTGFLSTYGVDEPAGCYDDLDRCDVVLLWGNNPAEMHPVLCSRFIGRRSRGEAVLLSELATRRTRTSQFCNKSMLFRPNTDLTIASGIARLLLERGTHDTEVVEKFCAFRADSEPGTLEGKAISFDDYRKLLDPSLPGGADGGLLRARLTAFARG